MPYEVVKLEEEGAHKWALVHALCNLEVEDDEVVSDIVQLLRDSYGESDLLDDLKSLCDDKSIPLTFNKQHLVAAVRQSLPDPDAEGAKPASLTNYRAEPSELLARRSAQVAYDIMFPAAPQLGKPNPNQPILGFDGWGISRHDDGSHALVLIQVKATDEASRPPGQADLLASECRRVPNDKSAICRTLVIMARMLTGTDWQPILFEMLEQMGADALPPLRVAPAIVRGCIEAHLDDLRPCRDGAEALSPAKALGTVTQVGVDLSAFGRRVAERARAEP